MTSRLPFLGVGFFVFVTTQKGEVKRMRSACFLQIRDSLLDYHLPLAISHKGHSKFTLSNGAKKRCAGIQSNAPLQSNRSKRVLSFRNRYISWYVFSNSYTPFFEVSVQCAVRGMPLQLQSIYDNRTRFELALRNSLLCKDGSSYGKKGIMGDDLQYLGDERKQMRS